MATKKISFEDCCLWQMCLSRSPYVVAFSPPASDRPQVAIEGEHLWFSCMSTKQVYAASAATGELVAQFPVCDYTDAPPASAHGVICFVAPRFLYCFDGPHRVLRWSMPCPGEGSDWFREHVFICEDAVVVGTHSGTIRSFSLESGVEGMPVSCGPGSTLCGLAICGHRAVVAYGQSGRVMLSEFGVDDRQFGWKREVPLSYVKGVAYSGASCVVWSESALMWVSAVSGQTWGYLDVGPEAVASVTNDGGDCLFFAHVGNDARQCPSGVRRVRMRENSIDNLATTKCSLAIHWSPHTGYIYESRIDGLRVIDPVRRTIQLSLVGEEDLFRGLAVPLVTPVAIYAMSSPGVLYAFRHPAGDVSGDISSGDVPKAPMKTGAE